MRYYVTFIASSLIVFVLLSCSSMQKTQMQKYTDSVIWIKDSLYWHKVSPINFIDTMLTYNDKYLIVAVKPYKEWYELNSLDEIKSKINRHNKKQSAIVLSEFNFHIGYTNFGNWNPIYQKIKLKKQGALLIKGIENKEYPNDIK